MVNVARLPNISGRQKWRERITEAWQGQIETIFGIGNLLEAAKEELPHGEWLKMVKEELPFGKRTANRLIAVATNDNLRSGTHASHLPASWMTLYELTRLTDEQFQSGIDTGVINPRMERKDVRALRGVVPKERKKAPVAPSSAIGPTDRCTMHVRATILSVVEELARPEWPALLAALREELDDIERTLAQRATDGNHAER